MNDDLAALQQEFAGLRAEVRALRSGGPFELTDEHGRPKVRLAAGEHGASLQFFDAHGDSGLLTACGDPGGQAVSLCGDEHGGHVPLCDPDGQVRADLNVADILDSDECDECDE